MSGGEYDPTVLPAGSSDYPPPEYSSYGDYGYPSSDPYYNYGGYPPGQYPPDGYSYYPRDQADGHQDPYAPYSNTAYVAPSAVPETAGSKDSAYPPTDSSSAYPPYNSAQVDSAATYPNSQQPYQASDPNAASYQPSDPNAAPYQPTDPTTAPYQQPDPNSVPYQPADATTS